MKAALERLGFHKTHHMQEVGRSSRQTELWHQVGTTSARPWDEIFEGYAASVDFPSATYYAELMAHFPDAKVVLTMRDVDRWYDSAASTIFAIRELTPPWAIRLFPPLRRQIEMTDATVWDRVFDGRFGEPDHAKAVYADYVAEVQTTVPADRLLLFNVAEGWEPLCAFLDRPVPDEPFPHLNDRATFSRLLTGARVLGAVPHLAGAVLAIGGVRSLRRRRR